MALIKEAIARSTGDMQETLARSGLVMIYAHWEGFVKSACQIYVKHINERISRYSVKVSSHYGEILIWRSIQKRGEFPHTKSPIGYLDAMSSWKEKSYTTLPTDIIDTESNLNFEVFSKILRLLDISSTPFSTKGNMIDEKILGRRNPIAHGERRKVNAEEFNNSESEVRDLIVQFEMHLLDCIENAAYMAKDA